MSHSKNSASNPAKRGSIAHAEETLCRHFAGTRRKSNDNLWLLIETNIHLQVAVPPLADMGVIMGTAGKISDCAADTWLDSQAADHVEWAERRLKQIPGASSVERIGQELVLRAPTAGQFEIRLIHTGEQWIVCFGDWHDEFFCLDDALTLIERALTGDVRLHINYLNGKTWRWKLERRSGDTSWEIISEGGFARLAWRRDVSSAVYSY